MVVELEWWESICNQLKENRKVNRWKQHERWGKNQKTRGESEKKIIFIFFSMKISWVKMKIILMNQSELNWIHVDHYLSLVIFSLRKIILHDLWAIIFHHLFIFPIRIIIIIIYLPVYFLIFKSTYLSIWSHIKWSRLFKFTPTTNSYFPAPSCSVFGKKKQ